MQALIPNDSLIGFPGPEDIFKRIGARAYWRKTDYRRSLGRNSNQKRKSGNDRLAAVAKLDVLIFKCHDRRYARGVQNAEAIHCPGK